MRVGTPRVNVVAPPPRSQRRKPDNATSAAHKSFVTRRSGKPRRALSPFCVGTPSRRRRSSADFAHSDRSWRREKVPRFAKNKFHTGIEIFRPWFVVVFASQHRGATGKSIPGHERLNSMHIAQIAPLTEAIPPKLYGGTERVVSWLTEELIALGHEVTLFASGD